MSSMMLSSSWSSRLPFTRSSRRCSTSIASASSSVPTWRKSADRRHGHATNGSVSATNSERAQPDGGHGGVRTQQGGGEGVGLDDGRRGLVALSDERGVQEVDTYPHALESILFLLCSQPNATGMSTLRAPPGHTLTSGRTSFFRLMMILFPLG